MSKWIQVDKDKRKCPYCETIAYIAMYPPGSDVNYCPNCGRDMGVIKPESQKHPIILGATLPTVDDIKTLLTKEDYVFNYSWWLKTPAGEGCIYAVLPSGYIAAEVVDENDMAIRPVLEIDITGTGYKVGDIFEFGKEKFKIISPNKAFMYKGYIARSCFKPNCYAYGANHYTTSKAKKIIDEWFVYVLQHETEKEKDV